MKLLKNLLRTFKKFKVFLILSFSILLFSCGGGGGNTPAPSPNPQTSNLSFSWEVVSPESQGLSAEKVTAAMNFAMNDGQYSQAVLIIKNGKIVAEDYKGIGTNEKTNLANSSASLNENNVQTYFGARDVNSLVTSWSVAKSVTSMIFGIAQGKGYFSNGFNVSASNFLTEWANDSRNSITLKNLLDMRSGLEPACYDAGTSTWSVCNLISINGGGSLGQAPNQLSGCIASNKAATGQTHSWYRSGSTNYEAGYFSYQNCDTMLLGEVFYRAVGQDIKSFADTHLFSKLNITAEWWRDNSTNGQANGNYLSYCCIDMSARDFAKLALLLMNNGLWEGEQIIPASYVQAIKNITTTSVVTETGSLMSYGLKFWSLYPSSVCGELNNELCVQANTIITPIGFDGQYMLMDFTNNLIMIRFSLYYELEQVSNDKKMVFAFPGNSNYILTAPLVISSLSLGQTFNPAKFWYELNN